jgi:hypothetical protein
MFMLHTEEYRVIKSSVSLSPPPPLPTTQMTMNVTPTNSPPTPIPQMKITRLNTQSGTGSEVEQANPPATLYGRVNYRDTKFDELKLKLQDAACTVYLRYRSEVVTGNDPIQVFEPIYVY